jgi:hypothetical protein
MFTDFNSITPSGHLRVRLSELHPGTYLAVGDKIIVEDGEGNSCMTTVVVVTDKLAYVKPDWPSWKSEFNLPDNKREGQDEQSREDKTT